MMRLEYKNLLKSATQMANLKAKFYYFYNMSPDVYKYPHEEKNCSLQKFSGIAYF